MAAKLASSELGVLRVVRPGFVSWRGLDMYVEVEGDYP